MRALLVDRAAPGGIRLGETEAPDPLRTKRWSASGPPH